MSEEVLESRKHILNSRIYIVGVPIRRSTISQKACERYRDILHLAKLKSWKVFATSTTEYFRYLAPYGWKILEKMEIPIIYISTSSRSRVFNFLLIINALHTKAIHTRKPIIILRPGSPFKGDDVVKGLLQKLKGKRNEKNIEILDTKSGIDIIGDIAERELEAIGMPRAYISALNLVRRKDISAMRGNLLLVHSLSDIYNARKPLLSAVITKLIRLDFGKSEVFIKSPKSKGMKVSVEELKTKTRDFSHEDHFTLAIFLK